MQNRMEPSFFNHDNIGAPGGRGRLYHVVFEHLLHVRVNHRQLSSRMTAQTFIMWRIIPHVDPVLEEVRAADVELGP